MPKQVSIQELKRHLSGYLAQASQGHVFVIAKHGKPVARLSPETDEPGLYVGRDVERAELRPVGIRLPKGALQQALDEDRADDR